MSKVKAFYHIVINTKNRYLTIPMAARRRLYAYIHAIITNNKCTTIRINGIENHVHILLELHPSVALSDLVATIKRMSALWMHSDPDFPKFDSWGKEYFACTLSYELVPAVKEYIINQVEHHKGENFEDEIKFWANRFNIDWHDYLLT